ncbi:MAG TPA: TonB-dependent receptor plug domain-containing protein [Rhizomicrobium sp.]|nr:TonB-dependent receptor plug domain-containing protein [Rhizomicrobium sp.]
MKNVLLMGTAVSAVLLLQTMAAYADAAGGSEIETVTVTAERRAENLQKTPVSVQVLSQEQISASHISSLPELQKITPSLVVQDAASNVNPYIRGVGATTQGAGYYASVATYVDGVYVTRLSSGVFDLDDIDSIQVLKGPQGTLYGRNATGGAIVITTHTAEPGDPITAHLEGTYGNYDEHGFTGRVSGGLDNQFAFSIGASERYHAGFIENLNPPGVGVQHDDFNGRDYYSVNGELTFQPNQQLSIVARGSYYFQNDRGAMGLQPVGLNDYVDNATLASLGLPANPLVPLNGTQAYYAGLLGAFGVPGASAEAMAGALQFSNKFGATYDNEANGFASGALRVGGMNGDFDATQIATGILKVSYDFGFASLTSNTSYTSSTSKSATEVIAANPATYPVGFNSGSIGFSGDFPAQNWQEDLQLSSKEGPIEWIVGANYLNDRGLTDLTGDLFGFNVQSELNHWHVRSAAAFVQATVPLDMIAAGLSLTGGTRYTADSYQLQDVPSFGNFDNKIHSSAWTYTARLNYQLDSLLLYGGVSTGFKSGTLNATNELSPGVKPEKITSYEVGAKWDITDMLRLNVAAFDYQYTNIHLQVTSSPLAASYLVNGTGADLYGLDFEGSAIINDWASLNVNGLLLHSWYKTDVVAGSFGTLFTKDKRLAGAPEWSVTVGPQIKMPFVKKGSLDLSVLAGFNGGYYFDAENIVGTGGAHNAKSFTTVDFNLAYTTEDGRWRASAFASNAFNEQYYAGGLVAGQIDKLALAAPPGQYGVTLDYFFN